jgi:hypothetical protein
MEAIKNRYVLHKGNLQGPLLCQQSAATTTRVKKHQCPCKSNPKESLENQNLSPLMKTFTWRLIRNAIATTERAGRYSQIPRHCSTCGQLETDSHLFLYCQLPTQV